MKNLLIILGSNFIVFLLWSLLNRLIYTLHPRHLVLQDFLVIGDWHIFLAVIFLATMLLGAWFARTYSLKRFLLLVTLSGLLHFSLLAFIGVWDGYDYLIWMYSLQGRIVEETFLQYALRTTSFSNATTEDYIKMTFVLLFPVLLSCLIFKRKESIELLKKVSLNTKSIS
jgi:hypothetical protein